MNKIKIEDFINDWTKTTKITEKNIDSLVNEISFYVKQQSDFIDGSISNDEIYKILKNGQQDSIAITKTLSENTKETKKELSNVASELSSVADEVLGETSSMLKPMINAIQNTNSATAVTDILNSTKSLGVNILGETSSILNPMLLGFNLMKAMTEDLTGYIKESKTKNKEIIQSNQIIDTDIQKNTSIQEDILDTITEGNEHQKQIALKLDREKNDKKQMGTIKKMALTMVAGLLIGGLVRSIVLPFEVIYKQIKKILQPLGIFSDQTSVLVRYFNNIKNFFIDAFKWITDFKQQVIKVIKNALVNYAKSFIKYLKTFDFLSPIITVFEDVFGYFNTILRSNNRNIKIIKKGLLYFHGFIGRFAIFADFFKFGFKIMGWPLQIVISLFDFIKGFMQSESKTFLGKIESGLIEVVSSFFELPIRMLAWIVEKLSFGKFQNLGDKWMIMFREGLDNLLMPFIWIKFFIKKTVGDLEPIFVQIKSMIKNGEIISNIKNFFINLKNAILGISSNIGKFGTFLGKIGKNVGKVLRVFKTAIPSVVTKLFWPITIFFVIVDFITGFFKSKSKTFLGKVKDGLTQAVSEMIKWPVLLLGMAIDKILSLFTGTKVKGTGEKMFASIKKGIRTVFDLIMWPLTHMINSFKLLWNLITLDFEGVKKSLTNIFKPFEDGFNFLIKTFGIDYLLDPIISIFVHIKDILTGVIDWVENKLDWIPGVGSKKTKDEKRVKKISAQILKKKENIKHQQSMIKSGDNRTAMGFSRKKIIENEQKDINELSIEKSNLNNKNVIKPTINVSPTISPTSASKTGFKQVTMSDGSIRSGGHRNWRNFNPGNIEYGAFAKKHGAIGTDGRFAIFKDMKSGYDAQKALLKTKNYQNKTLAGAISRYAPASENNTKTYTSFVSKQTGIPASQMMSSLSSDQYDAMVRSMAIHEGMTTRGVGTVINPQNVVKSKVNAKKKSLSVQERLSSIINKNMKNIKESTSAQNERPIIVNNDNTRQMEPPEDIESMSILWLNKSYGLG